MKAGIVALGIVVLLAGILLSIYSKTSIIGAYFVIVYPYQQAGIATLILAFVCMAIGAMLDDFS